MSKSNPLFVDSTKIGSDSIGCRVELSGLEIEPEQSVYVKFCDLSGFEESTQLQRHSEEPLFFGKIWLNHQQTVTYQFYVMGKEGIQRISEAHTGKATYIIEAQWKEWVATYAGGGVTAAPPSLARAWAGPVRLGPFIHSTKYLGQAQNVGRRPHGYYVQGDWEGGPMVG